MWRFVPFRTPRYGAESVEIRSQNLRMFGVGRGPWTSPSPTPARAESPRARDTRVCPCGVEMPPDLPVQLVLVLCHPQ